MWREYSILTDRTTESLWRLTLKHLRSITPRKTRTQSLPLHVIGDISLPPGVRKVLSFGPKFAVEPRKSAPELLSLVRQVSQRASLTDVDRCISEGVDVLSHHKHPVRPLSIKKVEAYLKEHSLSLLPADKEGGFVLMHKSEFGTKACAAVESVFQCHYDISLSTIKSRAKQLCNSLDLKQLASSIDRKKLSSLEIFFNAKTHKTECPLRVIVSERGTWQKSIALFLQEKLNLLDINDPYLIRSSDDVLQFLQEPKDRRLMAFSIDVKDLYYALPQDRLLMCIEDSVDSFGVIAFQNAAGVSIKGFLDLISTYLHSTFATWNGSTYLQKTGICIGSCIAPVLSDLFLAFHNRILQQNLDSSKIVRVFRYVDDYLVFLDSNSRTFPTLVADVLSTFQKYLDPLKLTHELPVEHSIRFLDLRLFLKNCHICWSYEPRAKKPLLHHSSAHSKLVKRGIAKLCLKNSLKKSCVHMTDMSFKTQTTRLVSAGYPLSILISVSECLLKEVKQAEASNYRKRERTTRPVIVPYIHNMSHKLKKVASRVNVDVVFSAPQRLSSLCKRVNGQPIRTECCTKNHKTKFVSCAEGVIYSFPLTCGKRYVGQTGRCLNDRLREHNCNAINANSGHLGIHCRDCGCSPLLGNCTVLGRSNNKLTREIIEAASIDLLDGVCVSTPSISLSRKELYYLGKPPQ